MSSHWWVIFRNFRMMIILMFVFEIFKPFLYLFPFLMIFLYVILNVIIVGSAQIIIWFCGFILHLLFSLITKHLIVTFLIVTFCLLHKLVWDFLVQSCLDWINHQATTNLPIQALWMDWPFLILVLASFQLHKLQSKASSGKRDS